MKINPLNIIKILQARFLRLSPTEINYEERILGHEIASMIERCQQSQGFNFETTEDYVIDPDWTQTREYDDFEEEYEDEEDSESSSAGSSPVAKKQYQPSGITEKQLEDAAAYFQSTQSGTRKLASMASRFRWIKGENEMKKIRAFIAKQAKGVIGSRYDKAKAIREGTYQKYRDAKDKCLIVKDRDFRRWALQINSSLKPPLANFTASKWWLASFKNANHIVSRKINQILSKSHVEDQQEILESAEQFVMDVRPLIPKYTLANVFNSDQSGFQKELHSGRTMADMGTKIVKAVVQSVPATTHSYTIQVTTSAAGKLLSPLFVCMGETGGKFPAKGVFQVGLYFIEAYTSSLNHIQIQNPNLYTVANTSHMMGKKQMVEWFEHVYFPHAPKSSLLLLDAWTTYRDTDAIDRVTPKGQKVNIQTIPRKCTPHVQPLDVFFFRQWKDFVRKITDRVLLDNLDVDIRTRDNILKLQSLTHNQFSAGRFEDFVRYAWIKIGYVDAPKKNFLTPAEVCFGDMHEQCGMVGKNCEKMSFIKCAHCELALCFDHFFVENHYHNIEA
jgi:hypothetical protein